MWREPKAYYTFCAPFSFTIPFLVGANQLRGGKSTCNCWFEERAMIIWNKIESISWLGIYNISRIQSYIIHCTNQANHSYANGKSSFDRVKISHNDIIGSFRVRIWKSASCRKSSLKSQSKVLFLIPILTYYSGLTMIRFGWTLEISVNFEVLWKWRDTPFVFMKR